MNELIGKQIGQYQVILLIRKTPVSVIYRAFDVKLNRIIALEIILPGTSYVELLFNPIKEYTIQLSKLTHPYICALLDCNIYEGLLCLAFDFSPTRIFKLPFNNPISYEEAFQKLIPIIQALAYAHSKQMIHGAVNFSNILIDDKGNLCLFDFGINEVIHRELCKLTPGEKISTAFGYSPPEQYSGETVNEQTDIYSLGMVIYHLITGHRLYQDDKPLKEIIKQNKSVKVGINLHDKYIPKTVTYFLQRCLAYNPATRFNSMQEVFLIASKITLNHRISRKVIQKPKILLRKKRVTRSRNSLFITGSLIIFGIIGLISYILSGFDSFLGFGRSQYDHGSISEGINAIKLPSQPSSEEVNTTPTPTEFIDTIATNINATLNIYLSTETPEAPSGTITPDIGIDYPYIIGTPLPHSNIITNENVYRLVNVAQWGMGKINQICWKPGDDYLAGLATSNGVFIIDYQSKQIVDHLATNSWVSQIVFSPDGNLIIIGDQDGLIRIWDLQTHLEIAVLSGHTKGINSFAVSPDGTMLASGSADKTIRLWDLSHYASIDQLVGHEAEVTSIVFSPDGKSIISGSLDMSHKWWDVKDHSLLQSKAFGVAITEMAVNTKTGMLFIAGRSRTLEVWDTSTRELSYRIPGLTIYPLHISVSSIEDTVSIADNGGEIKTMASNGLALWNSDNEYLPRSLGESYIYTHSIQVSPDGKILASAIWDGSIVFYSINDGTPQFTYKKSTVYAEKIYVSPDSKLLLAQNIDGTIQVWDIESAKRLYTITGTIVSGTPFSSDSYHLAVRTSQSTVRIYEATTGTKEYELRGHSDIKSIYFADEQNMLYAGVFADPHAWSLTGTGQPQKISPQFYNSGCKQISGAFITTYNLIISKNTPYLCRFVPLSWMSVIEYSPYDNVILAGGTSKLSLYDSTLATTEFPITMGDEITAGTISPGQSVVAIGLGDNTIRIWIVYNQEEIIKLSGHQDKITDLAFTPDSDWLISSSLDGTISIWGVP